MTDAFLASKFAWALPLVLLAAACQSTEHSRTVATATVATYDTNYSGPKYPMSVGRFSNASPYLRGIFSDGEDRLGNQAKTILQTHLAQTGRFDLLDRENLAALRQESGLSGEAQALVGAQLVLTGQVTEFGRKTTGDEQLFGVLGRGKTQVAYSKVSINVVDVATSKVVYAVQGAGEYALSDREVIGFGSTSGYDATLSDKVLNLSITDAVNKLVEGLERGAWKPTVAQ
ncbi:MAG: CsgG/HfaB family protein [Planctomycetota bacterium]